MPGQERPPHSCPSELSSTVSPARGAGPAARCLRLVLAHPRRPRSTVRSPEAEGGDEHWLRSSILRGPPRFPVCLPLLHGPPSPALRPPGHAPIAGASCSECGVPSPNCPCTFWLSSQTVAATPPPASPLRVRPDGGGPPPRIFSGRTSERTEGAILKPCLPPSTAGGRA